MNTRSIYTFIGTVGSSVLLATTLGSCSAPQESTTTEAQPETPEQEGAAQAATPICEANSIFEAEEAEAADGDPFVTMDEEELSYRSTWEERFPSLFEASSRTTSAPGCMRSEDEARSGLVLHELPDGSKIGRILCVAGAYNLGYAYFHVTETEEGYEWERVSFPACAEDGERPQQGVLFNPSFNPNTGNLTAFIKGRGLGDCGTSFEFNWQTESNSFCMRQCSHKPECDGRMDNWPETRFSESCTPDPAFEQMADSTEGSEEDAQEEPIEHGHGHRFTNPHQRAERWNSQERMEWQKPELLVQLMDIQSGMRVADLGAGTGFLLPFIAQRVGPDGRIAAVDIEESMLTYVSHQVIDDLPTPTELCLAEADRLPLNDNSIDRLITINTWHHVKDRVNYASEMKSVFRENGVFFIVDYNMESPSGPPAEMRLTPDEVISELEEAGYDAELIPAELPRQYIVRATPADELQ
jgi:SAM-dependent methyltransferase